MFKRIFPDFLVASIIASMVKIDLNDDYVLLWPFVFLFTDFVYILLYILYICSYGFYGVAAILPISSGVPTEQKLTLQSRFICQLISHLKMIKINILINVYYSNLKNAVHLTC